MSLSWSASSDTPGRSSAATTVPEGFARLRERVAAESSLDPVAIPAWRLPWTAGRLLAAAVVFPVLLLAVRSEVGVDRLAGPVWVGLALAVASLGALMLGSYLPCRLLGRGRPLGTSPTAAASFFYVVLAGYALNVPDVGLTHAAFAAAALAVGLVARTRGTRLRWHAR